MMCSVANDLINKIIRLKTAILNTDLALSTDCSFHNLMLNPNNILLKERERESSSNVHTVLPYPVGSMSSLPKGIQLKLPAVPSINVIPRKKRKTFISCRWRLIAGRQQQNAALLKTISKCLN